MLKPYTKHLLVKPDPEETVRTTKGGIIMRKAYAKRGASSEPNIEVSFSASQPLALQCLHRLRVEACALKLKEFVHR